MADHLESVLAWAGAPEKRFWENDLEMPTEPVWLRAVQPGFGEAWLSRRNRWQLAVLRHGLAARGEVVLRTSGKHPDGDYRALVPYYLIEAFARYKSKAAFVEHGRKVLPRNLRFLCEKANDDYDPLALCFALYHANPVELAHLLCVEKVFRSGFARMRLLQNVRRPTRTLAEFLVPEAVNGVLRSLDEEREPPGGSELRWITAEEGRQRIFIRRPQRPGKLIEPGGIIHGYRPEWIILEFLESGKRVNIASRSIRQPLQIADRIATLYYGTECRYENENLVTYAEQLRRFLRWLQDGGDGDLQVVELAVANSPLSGSPRMRISDWQSQPIGRAITHFERAVGPILEDVQRIESVKLLFRGKRVTLVFERLADDEFVVRYSDHRLDPPDRRAIEEYLGTMHGIAALSTETRDQDAA